MFETDLLLWGHLVGPSAVAWLPSHHSSGCGSAFLGPAPRASGVPVGPHFLLEGRSHHVYRGVCSLSHVLTHFLGPDKLWVAGGPLPDASPSLALGARMSHCRIPGHTCHRAGGRHPALPYQASLHAERCFFCHSPPMDASQE